MSVSGPMNRRAFLGAFAQRSAQVAVVAAAAPSIVELVNAWARRLFRRDLYDQWNVGLLDCTQTSSLHQLRTSDYPEWSAADTELTSGQFSFAQWNKVHVALRSAA